MKVALSPQVTDGQSEDGELVQFGDDVLLEGEETG